METKKPYVKPELEELGAVHEVTGDVFDASGIFDQILGRKPTWPPRGSH